MSSPASPCTHAHDDDGSVCASVRGVNTRWVRVQAFELGARASTVEHQRLGASMCEEMKGTSNTLTMVASLVVPQTRDERRGGSRQEGKEARGEREQPAD